MPKTAVEINGLTRKEWKSLERVVFRFKMFAAKGIYILGKIAESKYAHDLASFLMENAELIVKAVLEAAVKCPEKSSERHDYAYNVVLTTLPDMKSNANWINFAIEIVLIVIKLLAKQ